MSLLDWGWSSVWTERFHAHHEAGLAPARVTGAHRGVFDLITANGPARGELAGRLEYAADSPLDLPVPGDWVAVTPTDPALLVGVLDRQSVFTRAVDGTPQPLAANVDVAFLVCGLDHDWNPRRLDRYLVLARQARTAPVIVLNKRDVCANAEAIHRQASALAPAVLISATSDNLGQILGAFVPPGQTAALFGSSGAGKSTIVNALLGTANQPTFPVRQSDSRGRHTTTARTLFQLPQGWLLLDMPGIRTVGIAAEDHTVNAAFADVTTLAAGCRFHNCTHTAEPGCAVLANADPQRLAHYRQLRREADYQMRREDASAARAQKAKWKQIHAALRKRPDKRD